MALRSLKRRRLASGGNGEMDSGLCVSMRATQDSASLKTKSTVWTLAPRRGARSRMLVLSRSAGHEVGNGRRCRMADWTS
ncbi:hypothetical protein TYRP_023033 [Tyrophagus putrescentiae]|nr:hypothetical protein TYRP_023033 [Tyrophagus putrescentiae]